MPDRVTISSSATLHELDTFIQANKTSDQDKLRGKKLKDGTIELYLDSGKSSLLDRLSGAASKRNKAAAAGVAEIFKRFNDDATARGVKLDVRTLRSDVHARTSMDGTHALRAGTVQVAADRLSQIGVKLGVPLDPSTSPVPPPKVPQPTDHQKAARGPTLAFDNFRIINLASDAMGSGTPTGRSNAVQGLATAMKSCMQHMKMTPDQMRAFAMSSGAATREKLEQDIVAQINKHGGTVPPDLSTMIDEAFREVATGILGSKQTGTKDVDLTGDKTGRQTLPVIQINNKTYEPTTTYLGEGGFGDVYLYRNPSNHNDTIAFKIIKPPSDKNDTGAWEENLGETINEVQLQTKANVSGSPHVLKVEGAVRLDNGSIGIAMESAPHGSLFELAGALPKVIGNGPGALSPSEARVVRLTQLKSMLEGLQALQQAGVFHLDLKSPNCLIGADGKLKIIDFGKAREVSTLHLADLPKGLDNPRYLAPEIHKAQSDVARMSKADQQKLATSVRTISDGLVPMPPNADDATKQTVEAARQKLGDQIAKILGPSIDERSLAQLQTLLTQKADNWGVGIAALELMTGKQLLPDASFGSDVADYLVQWMQTPGSKAVSDTTSGPLPQTALMHSTGDPVIDDLLNGLLHKDPTQRLSVADALNHPAFRIKGVGDPAVDSVMSGVAALGKASNERAHAYSGTDGVLFTARNLGRMIAVNVLGPQLPDAITKAIEFKSTWKDEEVETYLATLSPSDRATHEPQIRDLIDLRNKVENRTISEIDVQDYLSGMSAQDKAKIKPQIDKFQTALDAFTNASDKVQKLETGFARVKQGLTAVV